MRIRKNILQETLEKLKDEMERLKGIAETDYTALFLEAIKQRNKLIKKCKDLDLRTEQGRTESSNILEEAEKLQDLADEYQKMSSFQTCNYSDLHEAIRLTADEIFTIEYMMKDEHRMYYANFKVLDVKK